MHVVTEFVFFSNMAYCEKNKQTVVLACGRGSICVVKYPLGDLGSE